MTYIKTFTLTFFLLFLNSCGENTTTPITTDISDMTIDPTTTPIYSTDEFLPTATAYYLDGTNADATDNINWKVSDSTLVSISNDIKILPLKNDGNFTLTAGYDSFKYFENNITVDIVGITDLNSSWWISTEVAGTGDYTLSAEGNYTDGTNNKPIVRNIIWTSSNTDIATIATDENYVSTLTVLTTGTFDVNATLFGSSIKETYN